MSRTKSISILSLFGLTYSAFNPDININLDGKAFQGNNEKWIQITCWSNKITIGCTAEFLTNQRSYDHLRGVSNHCYHSAGLCSEQLCTCSGDCKQFTLNITTSSDYSNTTFGCTVIVEVATLKYKATTVIKPVKNGFELFKKEIFPLYVNNSVQETTTHPPPEENSLIERIVLVIAICTGIICTLSVITVVRQIVKCCRRKSKQGLSNGNEPSGSQIPQQCGCKQNDTRAEVSIISCPDTKSQTEHTSGKGRFHSFESESNTDSGFSSMSYKRLRHLQQDADRGFSSTASKRSTYLPHDEDRERFSHRKQQSQKDNEFTPMSNVTPRYLILDAGKEKFEMESNTDSEFSSVSNIWRRHITNDSDQLFSIDEDVQQERELYPIDTPPYSYNPAFISSFKESCPRVTSESELRHIEDSTSPHIQSPYTSSCSSQETASLFETYTGSIRDPWSRPNSCTILPFPDSDDDLSFYVS